MNYGITQLNFGHETIEMHYIVTDVDEKLKDILVKKLEAIPCVAYAGVNVAGNVYLNAVSHFKDSLPVDICPTTEEGYGTYYPFPKISRITDHAVLSLNCFKEIEKAIDSITEYCPCCGGKLNG